MARPKSKRPSTKETYDRIRKPVPPPSKVEPDRRRETLEKLEEEEALEEMEAE